ncbi:MAG: albusnodin/ikarugamycin family macrolactam cyclase [Micromonosporaceae bacterium]|nr:albusnodin/ikarugamycin family macrolactam cyclase [Micromonosporaceae bacterium]
MRWFGGHVGFRNAAPRPMDAEFVTSHPAIWVAGSWPKQHVRVVTDNASRTVVVVGPCSATDAELATLLDGPPDSALTAWAGAYTIVRTAPSSRITIMTDPAGALPIYTTQARGGALVWASSSRALAGLTHGDVDESWLAASLVNPTAAVPGRSAWSGVAMLPPGQRVTVSADGSQTLRPAWQPSRLRRDEGVLRIRETLVAAVACRTSDATPAADLSGGLDSTTLAALAAKRGPITGVTVHPAAVNAGGDIHYARITAAAIPNLRHVLLPLDGRHLPYTSLDDLPPTDEPAPSTPTWTRLATQLRLLAGADIDCHLTGDGGDTVFGQPPVYLADLARSGRWLRLAADALSWARLRRASPWPLIAAAVRGDTTHLAGRIASPGVTAHAAELAARVTAPDAAADLGHADRVLVAEVRQVARTAHTESQLADAFGVAMHNPYLDARVLDTVLAVPVRARTSAHRYKPLLREVTVGLLPDPVRQRGAKGVFAGDHHRGLRANLGSVLALAEGRLSGLRLVDPRWLADEIHRAAAGLDVTWSHLTPLLCAETWLRTIAKAPKVSWTYEDRQTT